MAPCKPAKSIKIRVPRHNAQRLGPSLTSTVRAVATREKKLVQLPPPVQEHPGVTNASLENASEWNSLLLSARAQRGPYWDVSTQQFLVEKESELYYNPTPLLEATRSLTANNRASNANQNAGQQRQQQQQQQPQTPQQMQQHRQSGGFPGQQQQFGYMNSATPVMAHGTPGRSAPGMPHYGNVTPGGTPGSFFGGGDMGTPTRQGGMMNGTPGGTPDLYGRRITRGMADGFSGYAG